MRVTIASRRSDLARIQAYQVGAALLSAYPQIELTYSFHESLGDRNQDDPLWQMPEKGVFTQDFREGLLRGEYDLVVHSWKDLAIEPDPETEIAATLKRADTRDLLLVREDRWRQISATGSMSILTSSPRRSYNLDSFLRDALPGSIDQLRFLNVRGNVPTRVRKLLEQDVDALILAKAAVDRLLEANQKEFAETQAELREALQKCRWMVLPLRENPAAPAQGALAIEISRGRSDLREMLKAINCPDTFAAVTREREILRGYGGGCHQKIGVSVCRRPFGEVTYLRGLTDKGEVLEKCSLRASAARPPRVVRGKMWPANPSDADWFAREPISPWPSRPTGPLWIAKADALPDDWQVNVSQIVWTSGRQTWKRLARRGVWVNGSAESLGEHEDPGIDTLAGGKVDWVKLTHEGGYENGLMPNVATYRLVAENTRPALEGKSYFFWKSGSSFEYALSQLPWIKEMTHFCGPGNTQKILEGNGVRPFVFLDHASWIEEMSE